MRPNVTYVTILGNAAVLLVLAAVLAGRLTRVWVERRRGSAGVAAACAAGDAVQRGRDHALHRGGAVRDGVLQPRHPVLVRRSDPLRAGREPVVGPLLARGTSQQYQGGRSRRCHQLHPRRAVPEQRPAAAGAGPGDHGPQPDPGGDLRPADARGGAVVGRAERQFRGAADRCRDRPRPRRRGGGDRRRRGEPCPRRGQAGHHARADADDRSAGRHRDHRRRAAHRKAGGRVPAARRQPQQAAGHLRDDLRAGGAAGAVGRGADRPGAGQPDRAPGRPADPGGGAGAGR